MNKPRELLFRIDRMPGFLDYCLYLLDILPSGLARVCLPFSFGPEVPEGGLFGDPTARLSQKELEYLMTELWNLGIRPHGWQRNDGELGATKFHLEDMRKLVFQSKEK